MDETGTCSCELQCNLMSAEYIDYHHDNQMQPFKSCCKCRGQTETHEDTETFNLCDACLNNCGSKFSRTMTCLVRFDEIDRPCLGFCKSCLAIIFSSLTQVSALTIIAAIHDRTKGKKLTQQQEEKFKTKFGFEDNDLVLWLLSLTPGTNPLFLLKTLHERLEEIPFHNKILGIERDMNIIIDAE